jgi:hypothetical protein
MNPAQPGKSACLGASTTQARLTTTETKGVSVMASKSITAVAKSQFKEDAESYLARAASLLEVIYGKGAEDFHELTSETKDNVLWVIADELNNGIAALKERTERQEALQQ